MSEQDMKRRIFGVAIVAAGWNFNQSKSEVVLSDLALANGDGDFNPI